MAVSPDDRFAGLLGASAERGGWVPGDVYTADTAGDEEPVEPRRVRLPVLAALGIATAGILVLAFLLFRPAPQHSPVGSGDDPSQGAEADQSPAATSKEAETGKTGEGSAEGTAGAAAGKEGAASAKSANANGEVIVHITGAVNDPSVVTLKAGARVQDAVEAAGGLSAGADSEAVNLARVVADGEQIHIPAEGEEPAADVDGAEANGPGANGTGQDGTGSDGSGGAGAGGDAGSPGTADSSAAASGGAPGQAGKVDLNTADATTLETLPGVGPVTAEAIISHRSQQPFASVEDLLLVKGIGPKTFESLKDLVTVG
jgi:competence protein ComEA